jgi:predicted dehydrogenase
MIDEGVLGDIEFIVCEWVSSGPFSHRFPPAPVPEWWFDRKMVGGGVLLDMGSHMIDLTRWLVSGNASVDYVFLDHRFGLELEDSAILTLKFKGKSAKATLILGYFAREAVQKVNLYGTAGSVSSEELTPRNVMRYAAKEGIKNFARKLVGREIEPYAYSYYDKSYYQELKHFVDCIIEDKQPLVKSEDVVECAKLIDEAYEVWYNRMRAHDSR